MITKFKLYKGNVEILFNPEAHIYYKDDNKVPSVTNILSVIAKPALIPWAAKMATNYIAEHIKPGVSYDEVELREIFESGKKAHSNFKIAAAGVGLLIHEWISNYILAKVNGTLIPDMPISEDLQRSINKFLAWEKEYEVEFLKTEEMIYSIEHGFTGTFDFIARIKGELVFGDIKTSSGIWSEYWYQIMAYQMARQEEYPEEKYAYRGIIRIDKKEGVFQWKQSDPEDEKDHIKGFLAAKDLYNSLEKMKRRE